MRGATKGVDVVVCVHNAPEDVGRCLAALERTDDPAGGLRIILVDDGSETETAELLRSFTARVAGTELIRLNRPAGYTVAANQGLRRSRGEIAVLLNSDTVVPASWARKIAAAFARAPDLGLVGPLSNAGGWQSVPERRQPNGGWVVNVLPADMSVDEMDTLVARLSAAVPTTVRVPLLNGFCLAIHRRLIEAVGLLDETGFPRGYGEEDDYCLRAAGAGFGLAVAPDTYVFHAKSRSYGLEERNRLTALGQEQLRLKHSQTRLDRAVETMFDNPYLRRMRQEVAQAVGPAPEVEAAAG
ncbi:MAG: glycosyltransferase [Pseudomonadota bacterium]